MSGNPAPVLRDIFPGSTNTYWHKYSQATEVQAVLIFTCIHSCTQEDHILLRWKNPAPITVLTDASFVKEQKLPQFTSTVDSRIQQGKEFWCLGPMYDTNVSSAEPSSSSQRELQGHGQGKVEKEQIQKCGSWLSLPMPSPTVGYSHCYRAAAGHQRWIRLPASPVCLLSVQHIIILWDPEQENSFPLHISDIQI